MKGNNMSNYNKETYEKELRREKIETYIKELIEERFNEDCIEELENESFDSSWKDYIGECVWDEFNIDIEVEYPSWDHLEMIFYDMQSDILKEKYDDYEERLEQEREYREMQGWR